MFRPGPPEARRAEPETSHCFTGLTAGGRPSKPDTRRRFPQVSGLSAELSRLLGIRVTSGDLVGSQVGGSYCPHARQPGHFGDSVATRLSRQLRLLSSPSPDGRPRDVTPRYRLTSLGNKAKRSGGLERGRDCDQTKPGPAVQGIAGGAPETTGLLSQLSARAGGPLLPGIGAPRSCAGPGVVWA